MILPYALPLLFAAAPAGMGVINFPVTGNKDCQRHFTEGMLALHSFMYEEAHDRFQAAIKADPACAMARWGNAMAHIHPLWGEEEQSEARAALSAITGEDKLSPKERAYIAAARSQFGEGGFRDRLLLHKAALEKMHADFPKDDEVALQYALALIANSERLTKTKLLMEATAIAMEVLARHPNHPGAAHYLIHACDTPEHAVLALPAARRYAQIAPAASHALHMPAHIFVQLGMWREVEASNQASWAASEREVLRWKRSEDERDWHSLSWLMAARIELGQVNKAEALLTQMQLHLAKDDGPEARFGYALMSYGYVSSTGYWDQVERLVAPLLLPLPAERGASEGSVGCALHAPGASGKTRPPWGPISAFLAAQLRAEAALRLGDEKKLAERLADKRQLLSGMEPWKGLLPPEYQDRATRMETAFSTAVRAQGKKSPEAFEAGLSALRKLAELREIFANGPAFETPYQELIGEQLLAAGRPKEAATAFETALARYPNRARALLGQARALAAAGDRAGARAVYTRVLAQWSQADPGLRELAEARTGAAAEARGTQ